MSRDRVLVTGGAGFVGVNLGRVLLEQGHEVRCYDDFSTGRRTDAETAGYADIVEGDVRDLESLSAAARDCRFLVHLAAQAGVPSSVEDPLHDCGLNVLGTLNSLIAARDAGVQGFVFASSSAPLGDVTPPVHEGVVARPKSPYGASKLAGEAYCSAFAGSFDLATVALRFTNVYGPYSYHKGSVVAAFCKRARSGDPLVIYGYGQQTRDFIFVDDLCRGVVGAMTSGAQGVVAHVGSGVETSVQEVAEKVAARFDKQVAIEHRPARTGDIVRSFADTTYAASLFGFSAPTPLDDGLDVTVRWFDEHLS